MTQRILWHYKTPVTAANLNANVELQVKPGVAQGFRVIPGPGRTVRVCHDIGKDKSVLIMRDTFVEVIEEGMEPYFCSLVVPQGTDPRLVVCNYVHREGAVTATYDIVPDTGILPPSQIMLARIKPTSVGQDIRDEEIVMARKGIQTSRDLVRRDTLQAFGIVRGLGYYGAGDSFDISRYVVEDRTLYVQMKDGIIAVDSDMVSGFGPSKLALAVYPLQTAFHAYILAEYEPDNPVSCPTLRVVSAASYQADSPLAQYQILLYRIHVPSGNNPLDVASYELHLASESTRFLDLRERSRFLCLDGRRGGFVDKTTATILASMYSPL